MKIDGLQKCKLAKFSCDRPQNCTLCGGEGHVNVKSKLKSSQRYFSFHSNKCDEGSFYFRIFIYNLQITVNRGE